ncbi:PREDICTED: WUSCHEL-related homeobox 9-like isoform X2 [Nicotiana attenuata]|uniref:WUSCHEL-related homeobox 9-like isoform X2 n=1 Tax=Nicotiana attenuata TaxID=49451 RepID=UPI0009057F19|nr:PREDICTED: WUSCHEL-related homeobox 9-like isoform X2 [Nicotiana attenuata]
MASSNRHWPSMFKSKPCNQWQHDINSSLIQRAPCNPVGGGCEERSPEPKPRWNPRPEQIRILEAIFNSGMVNPPRDEIRKIRAKLQEYGQVGDANVFYWFQNRKSRSKHKQRHLQNKAQQNHNNITNSHVAITAPTSSSSSSEKSSPNSTGHHKSSLTFSIGSANVMDLLNSPTASVNQQQQQNYNFQSANNEFLSTEPFFFTVQPPTPTHSPAAITQGFCIPDSTGFSHASDSSGHLFLSEWMGISQTPSKKDEDEKINLQSQLNYAVTSAPTNTHSTVFPLTSSTIPTISHIQGLVEPADAGPTRSTVFINDVAFEVGLGAFNVREVFGDDAVLVHSSGEPLITNEWGLTLQPLQHGAFYYLLHLEDRLMWKRNG